MCTEDSGAIKPMLKQAWQAMKRHAQHIMLCTSQYTQHRAKACPAHPTGCRSGCSRQTARSEAPRHTTIAGIAQHIAAHSMQHSAPDRLP